MILGLKSIDKKWYTVCVMTTQEIAHNYVNLCRSGKEQELYEQHYSQTPVSIEMPGGEFERCEGFDQIAKKGDWWRENFELHSVEVSEPLVADNWFAVRFTMDTTHKPSGERSQMSELAVMHVVDGKIVQEQFFYDAE